MIAIHLFVLASQLTSGFRRAGYDISVSGHKKDFRLGVSCVCGLYRVWEVLRHRTPEGKVLVHTQVTVQAVSHELLELDCLY